MPQGKQKSPKPGFSFLFSPFCFVVCNRPLPRAAVTNSRDPFTQLNQCVGFILEFCSLVYYDAPDASFWDFHFAVPAGQVVFDCLNGQFYNLQARSERAFES